MEIIQDAIISALGTILVAIIGYLATKIATYFEEKGLTEKLSNKKYLVDIAVNAVEQVYQNENGKNKLIKAKQEALKLLNANGLEVTDAELKNFIEEAVKAMNDGFNSVRETDQLRGLSDEEVSHEIL